MSFEACVGRTTSTCCDASIWHWHSTNPTGAWRRGWFEICEEAAWAGPHWRSGLGTGLVGLRKIPDMIDVQPERRVATALVRFAALSSRRGTDSIDLRGVFSPPCRGPDPSCIRVRRHDSHWKGVWAEALAALRGLRHPRRLVRDDWLRPALPAQSLPDVDEPRSRALPSSRSSGPRFQGTASLPYKYQLDRVIERIESAPGRLDKALWREASDLIRRHWDYARASHRSFFAVRTTHNLCDRLLRRQPSESHLADIHGWTLRAIRADTRNAYVWDLWAKVLAAVGALEASLDVRWEAMRRFPDNVVVRNALIVALADRGRLVLAEQVLRVTLRDFPNDAIRPQLLPESPFADGRWQETQAALAEIGDRETDNPYAASLLKAVSDERLFGVDGPLVVRRPLGESCLEPRVRAFVDSLASRTRLLEDYFAASTNGRDNATVAREVRPLDQISSELELVVACRAHRRRGQPTNGDLDLWARARPASYSARLLLLARGVDAGGPDQEGMSRIKAEFPQHRAWNDWLGYAFVGSPRRSELRSAAKREDFWGGRLTAVYPCLAVPRVRRVDCEPVALRRLFEDVALAHAEVRLPQVPGE